MPATDNIHIAANPANACKLFSWFCSDIYVLQATCVALVSLPDRKIAVRTRGDVTGVANLLRDQMVPSRNLSTFVTDKSQRACFPGLQTAREWETEISCEFKRGTNLLRSWANKISKSFLFQFLSRQLEL